MRVISGVLGITTGEVSLEGRPLNGVAAHEIVEAGIAHVPENRRLFPRLSVTRLVMALTIALLALLPFGASEYALHIAIQILIWGFIYTAWSMMGRFGLTSFGHGAFLGVGAYTPALLWNFAGVTPWLGIPASMALAVLLAVAIGYPCFRLRFVGDYFALVTLALSQVVLLTLIAARDGRRVSSSRAQGAFGHGARPTRSPRWAD
jgi:ABC-type branched-subunit amino acid transport system permease subunit